MPSNSACIPDVGKSLPDPNENLLASLCCILTSTSPVINEGRQADNTILCKTEGGMEGGGSHGKCFQNDEKLMKGDKIVVKCIILLLFYSEQEKILTPQREQLRPVH